MSGKLSSNGANLANNFDDQEESWETPVASSSSAPERKEYDIKIFNTFEKMSFKDANGDIHLIPDDVLRGIYSFGWEKPSAIQSKAIVPLMEGHDLIAQAQSGTGKTGAFTIGTLCRVNPLVRAVQGLIILNTRELAEQVYKVITSISECMKIGVMLCMGGTSVDKDKEMLKRGPHIIIGTPGRVLDLITRGYLNMSSLRVMIMDESDELLSAGFSESIEAICRSIPTRDCNIGIFSATMPKEIVDITDKFMPHAAKILINKEHVPLEGIRQYHIKLRDDDWKFGTLCQLYEKINATQVIIFVNSTKKCEKLAQDLIKREHSVTYIYGKMTPEERKRVMDDFTKGRTRILITTDLLARGIDIQSVNLVINYEIPNKDNFSTYIHRIGRCGRFGRKGCAINFVTDEEMGTLEELMKYYKIQIPPLPANYEKVINHNC
jgi:superfamily II DNA/RNA helicase